jgi:hypothetical protein
MFISSDFQVKKNYFIIFLSTTHKFQVFVNAIEEMSFVELY